MALINFKDPITAGIQLVSGIIDRVFQDPVQRDAAKLELLKQQQSGDLDELKLSMSAILAEAQSSDKWTSRARPLFLYQMYGVINLCIIGGILGIWWPQHVTQAADNIGKLLAAIPDSLWWLFGAGYLGYTGARSFDKWRGVKSPGR